MRHLSTGQDGQADTAASCWWSGPVTKRDKVTSWHPRDTDLGVGLTHRLVQGLVGVDGLLQHTDVIADLAHLTVAWPASHALDVLKMVEINLAKYFGNVESFTFSAFWWKRTDSDRTVLLSSRPAAKFFQVLSRRDATFLKNEKHLKIKSSNYSGMFSSLTWRDLQRSDLPRLTCWQLWVFLICSRKHSENKEKPD